MNWQQAEQIPKIISYLWKPRTREELSRRTNIDEDELYEILTEDNRFVFDCDMPKGSVPIWHLQKDNSPWKIRIECMKYLTERDKELIKASKTRQMLHEKDALIWAWKFEKGYMNSQQIHPDDYLKYRRWLDNTEKRLKQDYGI